MTICLCEKIHPAVVGFAPDSTGKFLVNKSEHEHVGKDHVVLQVFSTLNENILSKRTYIQSLGDRAFMVVPL